MSGEVPAQFHIGSLPSAERFGRGGQTRGKTESVQQPIGFKALQEIAVVLHQVELRGADHADAVQIEGMRLRLDGVLYGSGPGGGGPGNHGGGGDKLAAGEVHSSTDFHYEPKWVLFYLC